MRAFPLFALLVITACAAAQHGPVDVSTLPPLSAQEQALLTTADVAANNHQNAQAEQNYMQAVALSKGHVEAHLALADFYLKNNQPAKAREVLVRAVQFQPQHVGVNYTLGKLYVQDGNATEALAAFNRGLEAQPNSLDLLSGAGIAHDMLRQHPAAQRAYNQAMAANPTSDLSMVKTNLAMSYLLDNQPQKAVDLLKTEMGKPGTSPVTRHNLALAYGMLGRHTEAKKILAGDLTEPERQASLKRLAQYIAGRDGAGKAIAAPMSPVLVKDLK